MTAGGGDDLFTDDGGSVHEADIDRIATAGITLGCNRRTTTSSAGDDTITREKNGVVLRQGDGLEERRLVVTPR